ncbi:MAG TPA: hypothetical protein DDW86_02770 [Clostridiales bacterium]|nr:hypothetical protein [Clostridiales bacterium]
MDVLYANEPISSIHPCMDEYSGYRNIAPKATITCGELAKDSDDKYLTDGLFSLYKNETEFIRIHVKETLVNGTSTFAFHFNKPHTVRAIMIYNSKNEEDIFKKVSRIEFLCIEKGREVKKVIKNLKFNEEFYRVSENGKDIRYVTPG